MLRAPIFAVALCALLLAGAGQAHGQTAGVKAGILSSSLADDPDVGVSSRTGFGGGAWLQWMVGESWSVQPELLYLTKGASEEDGDGEFKPSYLQLPVLVQFHVPLDANLTPRVFAGPSLAFELACDVSFDDESMSCEDFGTTTKSIDFGLVFGAGVDIPAGSVVVTLDARYDLGLTNIVDEDEDIADLEFKNQAWEFFAGIGIPIGP